jgi:hypothetical protein
MSKRKIAWSLQPRELACSSSHGHACSPSYVICWAIVNIRLCVLLEIIPLLVHHVLVCIQQRLLVHLYKCWHTWLAHRSQLYFCRTDVFNAAHLEGKNVVEVLQKSADSNVKSNMNTWLEEWTQRLMCAADCAILAELLLEVEGRITDSLTRKSSKKSLQKGGGLNGASAAEGGDGHAGGHANDAAHADKTNAENGDANADAGWLQDDNEYAFVGKKVRHLSLCAGVSLRADVSKTVNHALKSSSTF